VSRSRRRDASSSMPIHLVDLFPGLQTDSILAGSTCFLPISISHSTLLNCAVNHLCRLDGSRPRVMCQDEVLYIARERKDVKDSIMQEWDVDACLGKEEWRSRRAWLLRVKICYTPTLAHLLALLASAHLTPRSNATVPIFPQSTPLILVHDLVSILGCASASTLSRALALLADASRFHRANMIVTSCIDLATQISLSSPPNSLISMRTVIEHWCEWVISTEEGDTTWRVLASPSSAYFGAPSVEPGLKAEVEFELERGKERMDEEGP